MAKLKLEELKKRLKGLSLQVVSMRGSYFVSSHTNPNDYDYCKNLDALDRYIKQAEEEQNG